MDTSGAVASKSSYRDLVVWQRAVAFVTQRYRATQSFPDSERFGLISQLRRSAVSVASNIAEGQWRLTKGEFRQFLGQARGSLLEVETQIAIVVNLGYLHTENGRALLRHSSEMGRMINSLIQALHLG